MKPKKRTYCPASGRAKIFFETKEEADRFITYNSEDILSQCRKAPVRSYYCAMCCGYHVTSNPSLEEGEALDRLTSFPIEGPSFPLPEDVLEAASCYASLKGFSPDSPRQMSWALGWACYQACLREEGEDFCRLFISSWCRYYKR